MNKGMATRETSTTRPHAKPHLLMLCHFTILTHHVPPLNQTLCIYIPPTLRFHSSNLFEALGAAAWTVIMASKQLDPNQIAELDARARQGETVVPGGTGGKSLEAQQHLAEG